MDLESIFKQHYGDGSPESMSADLLCDLLCWCIVHELEAVAIVEAAANQIGEELPDHWHPPEWFFAGRDLGALHDEDWSPRKPYQFEAERSSRFDAVLCSCAEPSRENAVQLVADLMQTYPEEFGWSIYASSQKSRQLRGQETGDSNPAGIISPQELYEYEDLCKSFGKAETDKLLREIGYDPTDEPIVPGKQIVDKFMGEWREKYGDDEW